MLKQIYYDRQTKAWWAFMTDTDGYQLGDAVHAYTKEDALFQLGYKLGSDPKHFARPVLELFNEVALTN